MDESRWQHLQALFEQALTFETDARRSFLREACGSDGTLLDDVLGLLAEENDGGVLDRQLYTFSAGDLVGGRFRIIQALGEGGMGTVYEAEDLWLPGNQRIALKTVRLGANITREMHEQLEREISLARKITHSNICRIYDVGRHEMPESQTHLVFITMELVRGRTLSEHIEGGTLSPPQALRIIRQIVSALDAAHDLGIVHRDLKTSNVILEPTLDAGRFRAVITDFGLALDTKFRRLARDSNSVVSFGTPDYMSPELLAEALGLDFPYASRPEAASDIYALGIVIYEMVTGVRPLVGQNVRETVAKRIEGRVPSFRKIKPKLEKKWDVAVSGCLAAEPQKRFHKPLDVLRVLDSRPEVSAIRRAAFIGACVLVLVVAAALVFLRRVPASPLVLTRLTSDFGLAVDPILSADGRSLIYASDRASRGPLNLWVKDLTTTRLRQLTRLPASAHEADVSPDGREVIFRSEVGNGGIYRVAFSGGKPKLLAANAHYPRFAPNGEWIAYCTGEGAFTSLFVSKAAGGGQRLIARGFDRVRFPAWLPDSNHILFWGVRSGESSSEWWVVNVQTDLSVSTQTLHLLRRLDLSIPDLIPSTSFFRPSNWNAGHIVFSAAAAESDGTNLWRIDMSQKAWRPLRPPTRLTSGTDLEFSPYALSDGKIVFSSMTSATRMATVVLQSLDAANPAVKVLPEPTGVRLPTLSADGSTLAFACNRSGSHEIRLANTSGEDIGEVLATTPNEDSFPVITPDGKRVAYSTVQNGTVTIYLADGKTSPRSICNGCGRPTGWSSDGHHLLYECGQTQKAVCDLSIASGVTSPIAALPGFNLYRGHFSPDDKWIVVHADNGAVAPILVIPFHRDKPVVAHEWISISDGSGFDDAPRWSPDGESLYFTSQRDGYRCVYRQALSPTKRPVGSPVPIWHSHDARFAIGNVPANSFDLAVTRERILLMEGEVTGDIWMASYGR